MTAATLLSWLNFFVADVRDGLGPFLGVFLIQNGFGEADIGLITSIASIAALTLGVPCGILVDKTRHKKQLIAAFIALIVLACTLNYFRPSFAFTLAAQLAAALSGVFLAPAFAAITLGIMGTRRYAAQCARNEAFKHAGTVFGAALGFVFAFYFGIASIFVITAVLGACSLVVLALIRSGDIDDSVACGAAKTRQSTKIWALLCDRHVLFLSAVMFCFHLSNAAMLPLLSQRAHAMGVDSSGAYAAATIIIAQSTMILVAFVCGKLVARGENSATTNSAPSAENLGAAADLGGKSNLNNNVENLAENSRNLAQNSQNSVNLSQNLQENSQILAQNSTQNSAQISAENSPQKSPDKLAFKVYFWLFFACFFALIIRAIIAANFANLGAMVCVQILDGVGAGVSGVIVPIIVAFMLRGSGHINAGLAAVLTFGGLGAALSGGLGGYFAQFHGYFAAYAFLGFVAAAGLALWLFGSRFLLVKQSSV